MSKLSREAIKFLLSVFEQSGSQATPDLGRLLEATFGGRDSQLVMQAGLEAMKQARGRVTIADIQKQLDVLAPRAVDDHPSAEEAWSLVPPSEDETSFTTKEMDDACTRGGIQNYLERRDFIGAERTFKKLYEENVAKSRAAGQKAVWQLSLGHDKSMRVVGLEKAVSKGVISSDRATDADPDNEAIYLSAEKQFILSLPAEKRKELTGRVEFLQENIKQLAAARDSDSSTDWKAEEEPSKERLNDPHTIARAASLGLTPYEYLVRPCPPHVAAKVHAQLSKQYGIDLSHLTKRK